MSLTTVTVTGKWRLPDATSPTGTVRFEPSTAFQNTADDIFVVNSVEATLDASGAISVELYATDDADTTPENAQYVVTERIAGRTRIYNVEIPSANPTVDLADLAPTTAQTSVAYALTSHLHDTTYGQAVGSYTPTKIRSPRPSSTIADLSGPHGWSETIPGAGGTVSDDTDEFILSEQSIKVVTSGNGGTFYLDKTLGSAVDMTGKKFVLWVRTDTTDNLFWFKMLVGSGGVLAANYDWWVITSSDAPYVGTDQWVGVVLSFSDATVTGSPSRSALNRIRIQIADNAEGTPVTYWFGGIQAVDDNTDFANGVLTFSFDDGAISQFTKARPKLNEYGYAATAYVVQALSENPGGGDMSVEQLHVLDRLGWDVSGHAYSSDANSNGLGGFTDAEVDAELRDLRQWLLGQGFRGADHFAYPLGQRSSAIEERVRQHFTTARYTKGGMEHVPPSLSTRIRAYNVTAATSVATVTDLIDDAYANNDWLVLIFHRIVDSSATGNDVLTADFGSIVDYANTKGIPVRTVSEVAATIRA